MNAYQVVELSLALIVSAISIYAVVSVIRSPDFRRKPVWIVGCLFGFMGLGISWNAPDDLTLLFGLQIPVVTVFYILPAGPLIVKAMFPFIAAAALIKKHSSPA